MKLEVLISTCGADGLARVAHMVLPPLRDVGYLISLQLPVAPAERDIPQSLRREDIRIITTSTRGLSRNRNNALRHSRGDILLIADDDLIYSAEGLQAVIEAFDTHPELDFATFMHTGGDAKRFPDVEFDFARKEPAGYYLTSFELAVRRSCVDGKVWFPENMGAGTDFFGCGEENVYLLNLRKAGRRGRFFPKVIVEHPGITTGARTATAATLRGQGAWMRLRYGFCEGLLRLVRDVPRRNAPPLTALRYMLEGFVKI